MIAMLLDDWVNDLGHETLGPSHTISSALALIETSPPDAAIIDVSLGSGSGYQVAEVLSERNIPFVFATGHGKMGLAPRFAGTPILVKPFNLADVGAALSKMLDGKAP
jgi:CheY-like chemotaxis protein